MTTYAYPTGEAYKPAKMEWGQLHNNRATVSSLSGYTQTSSIPNPRWMITLTYPPQKSSVREILEGFLTRLSGMEHRVQLWDFGTGNRNGAPRGTINQTGVQISTSASQFATTIVLKNCGGGKTLAPSDKLGVNGQLLVAVDTFTANGSGVMTVEVRHPLRQAAATNDAVTLVKPTALFILSEPQIAFPRSPGPVQPEFSCQFVEVFA